MPIYCYQCAVGHYHEVYRSVRDHQPVRACPACPREARQVLTPPALVTVAPNLSYASPIDGAPITSWAARREDLARHDCIPYDPAMKQDVERRQEDRAVALDQAVEETVGRTIARLSPTERAQLTREVTQMGTDLEVRRSSPVPTCG